MRSLGSESWHLPFQPRTVIVWASITGLALLSMILIMILLPDMTFATELFAGITGVVSIGILIAAIAAAIYTKPAYDEFRRQQRPYDVQVEQFSLKDSYGKPLQGKTLLELDEESTQNLLMLPQTFAPPVFMVRPDKDIVIKFQVELTNFEPDRSVELRFNLFVPDFWDLHTDQEGHNVSRAIAPYELGGSVYDVRYSVAKYEQGPNSRKIFYADICSRPKDMQSIIGTTWPMAFRCSIGTHGQVARHDWSIEIANVRET